MRSRGPVRQPQAQAPASNSRLAPAPPRVSDRPRRAAGCRCRGSDGAAPVVPWSRSASAAARCGRDSGRRRRRPRSPSPRPTGPFKDALLARDQEVEGGLLQHGRRAGAEDRGRRRSRDVHVFAGAAHAARARVEQNRAWLEIAGAAGRRPEDRGRRRDRRGRPRRRRRVEDPRPPATARRGGRRGTRKPAPTSRNRRSGSRRSPTPACRRCSRCFPRRSATSRRCNA